MIDNALANCGFLWNSPGGDTGRRGAEHRGFVLLWFTHNDNETVSSSLDG